MAFDHGFPTRPSLTTFSNSFCLQFLPVAFADGFHLQLMLVAFAFTFSYGFCLQVLLTGFAYRFCSQLLLTALAHGFCLRLTLIALSYDARFSFPLSTFAKNLCCRADSLILWLFVLASTACVNAIFRA